MTELGPPFVWTDDVVSEPADTPPASVATATAPPVAPGAPAPSTPTMTAVEAQRKLDEMQADTQHPMHYLLHPRHLAALDERLALRRIVLGRENGIVAVLPEMGDPQRPMSAPAADPEAFFTRADLAAHYPAEWREAEKTRFEKAALDGAGASPLEAGRLLALTHRYRTPERAPLPDVLDLDVLWGSEADTNIRLVNAFLTTLRRRSQADHDELLPFVQRVGPVADLVLAVAQRQAQKGK